MLTHSHAVDVTVSPFAKLHPVQPDALLALIALHEADPRPDRLDLGVGVYRDAKGRTPIMRCIKEAEHRLLSAQQTKSYLGAEGDTRFSDLLAPRIFGSRLNKRRALTGVQTPGGTGALRLAAELVRRARPDAKVWIGTPTWPNHIPIFREAGLEVVTHRFFDAATADLDFDAMIADLGAAAAGDILLLHGCCHNPTGSEFSIDQWEQIAALCCERRLVPIVDMAYQGLGEGWEEDAAGLRRLFDQVPTALLAYSCDKNFGLYRDRVGGLWIQHCDPRELQLARDNMLVLARSLWSMPPDHGAALVRVVLDDAPLTAMWLEELAQMRMRLNDIRQRLGGAISQLAAIGRQRGMFAMLPVSESDVADLRERDAIYMANSGRINLAGLTSETVPSFVKALSRYL